MTSKTKATAFYFMAPPELQHELMKKPQTEREDYAKVRKHVDDAVYAPTMGLAPTAMKNHQKTMLITEARRGTRRSSWCRGRI